MFKELSDEEVFERVYESIRNYGYNGREDSKAKIINILNRFLTKGYWTLRQRKVMENYLAVEANQNDAFYCQENTYGVLY